MSEILEQKLIEETLETGFKASQMKLKNPKPSLMKDIKKEILESSEMKMKLNEGISNIVRNSIDNQLRGSLDHGGSSLFKQLEYLRFSNWDASESAKGPKVQFEVNKEQMTNATESPPKYLEDEEVNTGGEINGDQFEEYMAEIMSTQEFVLEGDKASIKNKVDYFMENDKLSTKNDEYSLSTEPNQMFLLMSQENQPIRKRSGISSASRNAKKSKMGEINISDYYGNMFNSILFSSNSQMKNSSFKKDLDSHMQREGIKKIDISSGLSQFLKSKIDSFVDLMDKKVVLKRGTIESMIKDTSRNIKKLNTPAEEGLLNVEGIKEAVILSDLDIIHEQDCEKFQDKTNEIFKNKDLHPTTRIKFK